MRKAKIAVLVRNFNQIFNFDALVHFFVLIFWTGDFCLPKMLAQNSNSFENCPFYELIVQQRPIASTNIIHVFQKLSFSLDECQKNLLCPFYVMPFKMINFNWWYRVFSCPFMYSRFKAKIDSFWQKYRKSISMRILSWFAEQFWQKENDRIEK